ncbi:hypothetical protein OG2516_09919 [Oceanicola granulosus HTCC2516]|uniref:Lipoprotein n=1 Tax=Oceanicola granulosus (strain ATCC BAA-861 / DSM 15982 / KCTC 12143 / HTCC2516) TaxID=314256 RepID=Q2CDK0_OCEGH|nr:YjbF family lipoprotein [Oceanicola granulosus]EAR50711.1 hypothetical protein OG2516_09919 [Oceanicola granulosus HTCC2516]
MTRDVTSWIGRAARALLLALLPLAGCSTAPAPRFAALAEAGGPALQAAFVDSGANIPLLHEARRGEVDSWIGPGGGGLALRYGLLAGVRGYGAELLAADASASAALLAAGRTGTAPRSHRYLTGDDRAVTRHYTCDISDQGPRTLDTTETRLFHEACTGETERFLNLYWLDATGRIVQSRQWTGPARGAISLRPLRPG